ncbi:MULTISPECIES: right-handed parallel beta-helix repeat-containing protein [Rhizobium]|uniref:right-handed parallel beta-helix repeat-containing protein n=1 Tax=Rhizobium TaxID=379 RepID=UPI001B341D6A|nr:MULTISPECIES: right-handed parallel beta-helix repeat-containing protein [Rhizobium]MBX4908521.1 right-handed parallel beta-helix repeat-containing protein [Rhizobium bangladeshense]MBX5233738.1 right-handed parallel beta-helix repeat-containing protein [Rhizobium sp. NLR4a]MBX5246589.1 right-handed parallel beta-helix repeat-containing protein [Rhizobium sp. NLR3b]MBX5250756.1 right-handed parallel beta-helix repeat-containing protein [Rhizobium sp. NLR4b]MBX5257654.1 right-handed parallel
MTVYYVNSVTGSDHNSGTGESSAFATLSAVEALKLNPGDSVLLAAGSVFNEQFDLKYSGTVSAPITIGSYGIGDAPVIHSSNNGIHGSKASNIIVENIKIADTGANAIYAGSVSNWIVRNVEVSNTGQAGKAGSLSFQSSQNITIENSTLTGVHADGIWMDKVKGVTLVNNTVTNSQGSVADAIQLNNSSNILIKDNHLEQTETNSAKGVLVLIRAQDAVVEGNTLVGGGFGLSAQAGTNIAIHDNDISGYGGYSWSYGIGLGDSGDAKNYDISGNYLHDGVYGVLVSAVGNPAYVRENIIVHDNVFDDLTASALKVDRSASGSFYDNVIDSSVSTLTMPAAIAAQNTFSIGENKTLEQAQAELDSAAGSASGDTSSSNEQTPVAPVSEHVEVPAPQVGSPAPSMETPATTAPAAVVPKIVAVHDSLKIAEDTGSAYHGNLLDNDNAINGTILLRRFGDSAVDKHGLTLTGKYGVIHVESDGDYSYTVDATKLAGLSGKVSEFFQYKISDGASHIDTDSLSVSINVDAFHSSHASHVLA